MFPLVFPFNKSRHDPSNPISDPSILDKNRSWKRGEREGGGEGFLEFVSKFQFAPIRSDTSLFHVGVRSLVFFLFSSLSLLISRV